MLMARDDAAMSRELVLARLRSHRAALPTAWLSSGLALVAVALILRGGADRPLPWLGISGLVLALLLRMGAAWAYDRRDAREGGATPEAWLLRFRGVHAAQGLAWMLIALQLTVLAAPANHTLVVFALTALVVCALVSAAFDWLSAVTFSGLTFVPLLLSVVQAGKLRLGPEMVVALSFIAVMLLALRRSELSLRQAVLQQLAVRASAAAARGLAAEAESARRELAVQNHRMTQLLATTRQGCWFIDGAGITTDVNDAMCELLARPREWLVGRRAWDCFSGEALATLQREMLARREGRVGAYAITITRSDSSQRHCRNNASPLFDAQGGFMGSVGLWTDLTDMVEANRDLQIHAWAINSITDAVSVIGEDTVYRMVNDAWCRGTGMPREQVVGRNALKLMPPGASTDERLAALRACLASNEVQVLRAAVEWPGQEHRTVQTHLYPYDGQDGSRCVVMVTRDVTAEEQVLRALQASEAEQRALLDAFPGYIVRLDSDLVYRYVNQKMVDLLGTSREAMVGRSVGELFGAEREALIRDECQRALAGEVVVTDRRIAQRPDGHEVWVQITTAVGQDPRTGEPQFYAFCADVTGLHRAQLATDDARAEAERANHAKSQFLSQMSHELRTPMNAILGFAELLDTDAQRPLADSQRSQLREIRRGGEHLLGLINEVLELGRIEAGHLVVQAMAVDLRELLTECLNLLQPLAGARPVLLLPLRSDAAASHVRADPLRLKQVLLNLLGNAIKYNHPGGEVEVFWAPQGPHVQINVRDSGPGLELADQARVFEPFERLAAGRGDVEGAGMGLALSRRLVQAMGGEIGVDSQPAQGSTFWLRLPSTIAPEPLAASRVDARHASFTHAADAVPHSGAQRPAARVLYIEDNPVNLVLMEAMLERLPEVDARCVISPFEGLALAAAEPPDLVLLDLQMPLMDGFEVLRRLRAEPALCHIPVLAVSANALPGDIEAALAAGFNGYLSKPLQLDSLAAAVRGALSGRSAASGRR